MLIKQMHIFLTIIDTINDFVGPLVEQALTLLSGFPVWIQAAMILALGIFAIIGLFVFLKKFIKLFIGLAVLGGIAYFAYTQGWLDSVLGAFANLFQ